VRGCKYERSEVRRFHRASVEVGEPLLAQGGHARRVHGGHEEGGGGEVREVPAGEQGAAGGPARAGGQEARLFLQAAELSRRRAEEVRGQVGEGFGVNVVLIN